MSVKHGTSGAANPAFSAIGISKAFGARSVLRNISFTAQAGEVVALLGASGAGKTTLIRCIAGIEVPDAGRLSLRGTSKAASASLDAAMLSVIFQDLNLIRRLSAIDNVLAAIANELSPAERLLRVYRQSMLQRAIGALDQVGIAHLAWTRADKLSGGEQQRVAIARALARHSHLIIADEPVASLDETTARDVLSALRQAGRAAGAVVICSLHQIELAREFADRIIGLRAGELLFDRPSGEIDRETINKTYLLSAA